VVAGERETEAQSRPLQTLRHRDRIEAPARLRYLQVRRRLG
jgi:hypothetical protein